MNTCFANQSTRTLVKPLKEAFITEIFTVINEIDVHLKSFKKVDGT
jgi:hypothetical protein